MLRHFVVMIHFHHYISLSRENRNRNNQAFVDQIWMYTFYTEKIYCTLEVETPHISAKVYVVFKAKMPKLLIVYFITVKVP